MHRLEADSIQLSFGAKRILSDIYLKCETGKITGLLGRNGAGKSCLMNIIYGSLNAENKSVRMNGIYIAKPFKRPDWITYLPQFHFIPASFSVKTIFRDFNLDFESFIRLFPDFKKTYLSRLGDLSGGQRRIIEVYVIVKSKSKFSMLDEPFSHIMPVEVSKITGLLNQEKTRKGFLITDHLYQPVIAAAGILYVLKDGKTHAVHHVDELSKLGYIHH